MTFYRILPNLFTIGNMALGIIAIILAFNGQVEYAAILIIISMALDGIDGTLARIFNTQSNFGKELDSLSDLISFGLAPVLIMYVVMLKDFGALGWIIVILFPVAGALRLARFNVRTLGTGYFIGLPITTAGAVLATLTLYDNILHPIILITIIIILSFLMVSNIKYPNLKKKELPRGMYLIAAIVIMLVITLALLYPKNFGMLLLIPLGLYVIFGHRITIKRIKNENSQNNYSDSNEQESL